MVGALLFLALQAERIASIEHPEADEVSGIVASRKHPGVFWVHNDSGDRPRLFAIRSDGRLVAPAGSPAGRFEGVTVVGAKNVDWEDIASDGENLYLADVGNNANTRRDLVIYVVPEPDPARATSVEAARAIPVAFDDQQEFPPAGVKPFDCEAVFYHRGALWLLTKHRSGVGLPLDSTALYRLPMEAAPDTDVRRLRPVDRRDALGGWVTGADVSPSGRTLAVLTHLPRARLWLFDLRDAGERLLSRPLRTLELGPVGQVEAVAFEGENRLILVNESRREIFRVDIPR